MYVRPDSLDIYGQTHTYMDTQRNAQRVPKRTLFGPLRVEKHGTHRRNTENHLKTAETNCYIEMYVWMFAVNIDETGV